VCIFYTLTGTPVKRWNIPRSDFFHRKRVCLLFQVPVGMLTTQADTLNADLLAFIDS
jgi:hypothetical protein